MSESLPTAEYDRIMRRAERALDALRSTPWWHPIKSQNAAREYRYALLAAAFWELDHPRVTPPAEGRA